MIYVLTAVLKIHIIKTIVNTHTGIGIGRRRSNE